MAEGRVDPDPTHLRLRLSESLSGIELWFVTVTVVYKSKLQLTTTLILNYPHGVSVPQYSNMPCSPPLVGLLLALRDLITNAYEIPK